MIKLHIFDAETLANEFYIDEAVDKWLAQNPDIRIVNIQAVLRKTDERNLKRMGAPDYIELFISYEGEIGTAEEISAAKQDGSYKG